MWIKFSLIFLSSWHALLTMIKLMTADFQSLAAICISPSPLQVIFRAFSFSIWISWNVWISESQISMLMGCFGSNNSTVFLQIVSECYLSQALVFYGTMLTCRKDRWKMLKGIVSHEIALAVPLLRLWQHSDPGRCTSACEPHFSSLISSRLVHPLQGSAFTWGHSLETGAPGLIKAWLSMYSIFWIRLGGI